MDSSKPLVRILTQPAPGMIGMIGMIGTGATSGTGRNGVCGLRHAAATRC